MATYRHFSAAINAALGSPGQTKHGAALVLGGKVLAVAYNTSSQHAELAAVRSYLKSRERVQCFKGLKGKA